MIDALTVKLPNLGVNILPVQFRQIKDPMDIVKLAITSQVGAYLNVDEIIEVAKLLGLRSQDDISSVQEAIAREAAVVGDLQLAFDLCLVLAKTGHGSIWDLCAAMTRGRDLENIDITSRKQLLGFALSHCDEESIGELLHAWKDLDMQVQCEKLMVLSGTDPPKFSVHGSSIISSIRNSEDVVDPRHLSEQVDGVKCEDQEVHIRDIRNILAVVAKDLSKENGSSLETLLRKNGKISSFAALQLPWLLELSHEDEYGTKLTGGLVLGKPYIDVRTQAVVTTLSWLAQNEFAPRDDLIASLAKSIMKPPVGEEEDIMGSSFLLNLLDAFHGVEIVEEQVRTRESYNEICSIMSVGMIYSLLHNSTVDCHSPAHRRELLLKKFQEKHTSLTSDELDKIDRAQSSFWRDWKLKLEEQKRVADHSRVLEQIIPGVETMRFLSGDINYIESVVFSLVESVKIEKKHILKDILKFANTYGLNRTKVFLRYLSSVLVSEVWALDDITAEISEYKNEILAHTEEAIKTISLSVYPVIQGHDKPRLAYLYGFLSDCYLQLEGTSELMPTIHPNLAHINVDFAHFYKVIEQECSRVSFIKNLNFKNIAGLGGLNFKFFTGEIYAHVDECSVEALATMVQTLIGIYTHPMPEALITGKDVYRYHVLCLLQSLEDRVKVQAEFESHENLHALINELEKTYDDCRKYVTVMACPDVLDMGKQFFKVITPLNRLFEVTSTDSTWQDCLIFLSKFWLRVIDDMREFTSPDSLQEKFNLECLMCCLKVFTRLVIEGRVSPKQSWVTFIGYVNSGLKGSFADDIYIFCRAMGFSGCSFGAIAEVYSEAVSQLQTGSGFDTERHSESIQDLPHLYSSILETVLENSASESLDRQNLHHLLSSLSRTDGDLEDLNRARRAVWERMTKFCDNLMLPNHVRVYVLELMQFISDSGRNVSTFSAELKANVLPWEEWDDLRSIATENETISNYGVPIQPDTSNRLTATLVALKSSQLVLAISPSIEISPQDLSTVDSAVACFIRLCREATFEPHIDALLAILREWEGLFTIKWDKADSAEVSDAANDWGIDDWDEGWESFPEETGIKESKKDDSLLVHPLHLCWMQIFKKLVTLSRFRDLLKLIDQSVVKSNGVLLDQVGAHSLAQIVLGIDCFVALKLALSFPYEEIRLQCLDAVEDTLKQGGVSDVIVNDHEILVLVLSSGIVSTIMSRSKYGTTFSFLSYMIGRFSRQYQETQLSKVKQRVRTKLKDNECDLLFLFGRFLFPCFVSELVKADQQILAGFLVTKFLHTSASLSLINVAEASLKMFFERQLQILHDDEGTNQDVGFVETLGNTISQLRGRLENLIQSALSSLTTFVR